MHILYCIYDKNPSLPARGAWIEIKSGIQNEQSALSLPARGAWIEIGQEVKADDAKVVAPRKGSVD